MVDNVVVHLTNLIRLLELEGRAEAELAVARIRRRSAADAERTGNSLTGLTIREEEAGLGGRCLLTFGKKDISKSLPWTRLDSGSPVLISITGERDSDGFRGVVSRRTSDTIQIALNEPPEFEDERPIWRVDLSSDEVARQRQRQALERAIGAQRDRLAKLRQVLLGEVAPEFKSGSAFQLLDSSLNESQIDAVRFALTAEDVAIIHGPPGTGKTTTVVELIRQAIRRDWKVLACAASNLAVDNLLERLVGHRESAVRLGHPARVLADLRDHTLDLLVESHEDVRLARKLMKDAYALFARAARFTRAKPAPGEKRAMREEARALIADARRMEAMTVQEILDKATVVCATLTGLDRDLLADRRFDLVVIDEACQSIEPGCWIPLLRSDRVVLAGDHRQLPPTVLSVEAARQGLSTSLMERLMELRGPQISRQLTVQYRMHSDIMKFSSDEFYQSTLQADPSVAAHLLKDLPDVVESPSTSTPMEFVDTAGASYAEELEPDGDSRQNPQECEIVVQRVQQLVDSGVPAHQIGVIAPYSAQVRLLRERLKIPGLEVDTVDGFQGREKEALVISCVRSNAEGEIGFLSDTRRMNVALTRARRKLIVIADSATIASHPTYQNLIQHFERHNAYRTVWEDFDSSDATSTS